MLFFAPFTINHSPFTIIIMAFDLKSLKSLFVVETETAGAEESAPRKEAPTSSAPPPQRNAPAAAPSAPAGPGNVTDKFMQVLLSAMEKSNLPGLDYLEYKQSLNSLAAMPMDEEVRFKSAFAMAQAMGATQQKLMESATHYLDVLKGEAAKFQQALSNQQTEQITNREGEIKAMEQAIIQKSEQIKKLTLEAEQNRKDMEKLRAEISEASSKLMGTKSNFEATYQALTGQIVADVEKMKRFLA